MSSKIGITGATGYLGRHLVTYLSDKGYSLRVLVRDANKVSFPSDVEVFEGNILDSGSLETFVESLDVVIHLAAQVSKATKETYHRVNVSGTRSLCEEILKVNPSCKFIHTSSISSIEYQLKVSSFFSDYAVSKAESEAVVDSFEGLSSVTVYPSMIIGGTEDAVAKTYVSFLKSKIAFMVSGGESNAPFIHLNDLCDLYERLLSIGFKGQKYVASNTYALGMHGLGNVIRESLGLPKLTRILSQRVMYRIAIYLESLLGAKAPLKKRYIHFLSLNLNFNFGDDARADLGWVPNVDIGQYFKNYVSGLSPK